MVKQGVSLENKLGNSFTNNVSSRRHKSVGKTPWEKYCVIPKKLDNISFEFACHFLFH